MPGRVIGARGIQHLVVVHAVAIGPATRANARVTYKRQRGVHAVHMLKDGRPGQNLAKPRQVASIGKLLGKERVDGHDKQAMHAAGLPAANVDYGVQTHILGPAHQQDVSLRQSLVAIAGRAAT